MGRKIKVNLAEWMINNLGEDSIETYWSDKNELSPWVIGSASKKSIYIKCPKNHNHEDYETTPNNFIKNSKCKSCNSIAQWGIDNLGEDFLVKYWSDKNQASPWEIDRGSTKKKILINCQNKDYHGEYPVCPSNFSRGNRCPFCRGNKVHPKDSFAQWCIDNVDENFIGELWSEENTISPWEIAKKSKQKVYIKCQEKDYHYDYIVSTLDFSGGKKCPACAGKQIHPYDSFAQWGINNFGEGFLEKYWDFEKNINYNPWKLGKKSNKKVYLKCQNTDYHGSTLVVTSKFTDGKHLGCSYCSKNYVHPKDSLGTLFPQTLHLWSNKNIKTPFEYSPMSQTTVYWKCEHSKHDDYKRPISNSNQACFRCPKCSEERNESFLQEKVRLFLTEELGYNTLHEHSCDLECINSRTGHRLPYDNEVNLNNSKLIIEVHGQQHYIVTTWAKRIAKSKGITPQEELEYIQWKDSYKKEFALSQGYYYLEIPYWTDDDNETWKELILKKLKQIN